MVFRLCGMRSEIMRVKISPMIGRHHEFTTQLGCIFIAFLFLLVLNQMLIGPGELPIINRFVISVVLPCAVAIVECK